MTDLISVVIPIYNVEKFLKRCLESVRVQTYSHMEVLLVNDGSSDGSLEIANKYADLDKRFFVINKSNGGLSDARNAGIKLAKGRYITFIDSDDYVSSLYIEILYKLICEYNADISIVEKLDFRNETVSLVEDRECDVTSFNRVEAIKDMWYQKNISNAAWGKLYNVALFDGIEYPVGKLYEDMATTYKLFWSANKIVYCDNPLYYYFQREDSIMNSEFSLKKMDRIYIGQEIIDWSRNTCEELLEAAYCRMFISNIQVLNEIPYEKAFKQEILIIKNNVRKYRNKVWKNKEVKGVNRIIAFCACLNLFIVKQLGKAYNLVYKRV